MSRLHINTLVSGPELLNVLYSKDDDLDRISTLKPKTRSLVIAPSRVGDLVPICHPNEGEDGHSDLALRLGTSKSRVHQHAVKAAERLSIHLLQRGLRQSVRRIVTLPVCGGSVAEWGITTSESAVFIGKGCPVWTVKEHPRQPNNLVSIPLRMADQFAYAH